MSGLGADGSLGGSGREPGARSGRRAWGSAGARVGWDEPRVHAASTAELLDAAIAVAHEGATLARFNVVIGLTERVDELVAIASPLLRRLVGGLWERGWQPFEAVRHVRRGCSAVAVRLMVAGVVADHATRDRSTLDRRWIAQVDDLLRTLDRSDADRSREPAKPQLFDTDDAFGGPDAPTSPKTDDGRRAEGHAPSGGGSVGGSRARSAQDPDQWLRGWFAAETDRRDAVVGLVELIVRLQTAPVLETLIPPPDADAGWRPKLDGWLDDGPAASASVGSEADPVLEKVRALLAKAESTSFEAEAEAFTAKAQELIARHSIDAALLASSRPGGERPAAIRVCIDDPYADAKALLLQLVAAAGRCRSVASSSVAMSTVVGFPSDLAAVELLFTSLLVQAQSALAAAARTAAPGARTRSRSFRSAFLLAYATRIGQRLEQINDVVVAETEAEQGRSLLPVLGSREAEVDDALDDLFGGALTSHQVRGGYDAAGWASGQHAADAAELNRSVAPER